MAIPAAVGAGAGAIYGALSGGGDKIWRDALIGGGIGGVGGLAAGAMGIGGAMTGATTAAGTGAETAATAAGGLGGSMAPEALAWTPTFAGNAASTGSTLGGSGLTASSLGSSGGLMGGSTSGLANAANAAITPTVGMAATPSFGSQLAGGLNTAGNAMGLAQTGMGIYGMLQPQQVQTQTIPGVDFITASNIPHQQFQAKMY